MFGVSWPHQMLAWARMALPRSLPALPPARSRSTWSARSEARTYDVDGRRVAAIVGDEVGPDPIHDQRLQDRQLGPKLTRRWGQNSPAKPPARPGSPTARRSGPSPGRRQMRALAAPGGSAYSCRSPQRLPGARIRRRASGPRLTQQREGPGQRTSVYSPTPRSAPAPASDDGSARVAATGVWAGAVASFCERHLGS